MIITDITIYREKQLDVMTRLSSAAHEARINLIGQMTAEIAHEINQPLSAIANYSVAGIRMQRLGKLRPEEIMEIFQEIDDQVHRASEIINHLNKFSKKREIRIAPTNINRLIKDVIKLMTVDKHWFGIQINTELDKSIGSLDVDGILIEQVIINIMRNAIEAMQASGQKNPLITLKTLKAGDDIVISITDNGPGVSYEMLSEIFTPFYSTKESGVGLGLSICKWIIESHDGRLWATRNSPYGIEGIDGTTFYIQLPKVV
jgi:C4-dicarboxylate-specific signal transduction histidine kinase